MNTTHKPNIAGAFATTPKPGMIAAILIACALVFTGCEKAKHEVRKVQEETRHETTQTAEDIRHAGEVAKEKTRHEINEATK